MIDVCVVIVTQNHKSFIGPCIDSVMGSKCLCSFQLFVVDDGSVDGTQFVIQPYSQRLTLIARSGGHSFSDNNNVVLTNIKAKYYLVLNPDTILPQNGIDILYRFMEDHPSVGACGPKLVYPDGTLQLSCRRFPNLATFLLRRTPFRYLLNKEARGRKHLMANWEHNEVCEVDWLLAACVILRAETLIQVGYFDERFRLYCEDIDLCYRFWKKGWPIFYNPEVAVVHNHQARTDKTWLSRHTLWHFQSMMRYILKHGLAGFRRTCVTRKP